MDEMNHNITPQPAVDPVLRRDMLISQIIDAEGDGSAWNQFTQLAASDPAAWRELAQAQRDHAALSHTLTRAVAAADVVELPAPGIAGRMHHAARLSRTAGWAVAAALALAWFGSQFAPVRPNAENIAGLPPNTFQLNTPQDALAAYQQLGRRSGSVLGEVPDRVIVEYKPLASGDGFEVVFLRQFMERAEVPKLFQVTRDDSGQQGFLMPVSQPTRKQSNRSD